MRSRHRSVLVVPVEHRMAADKPMPIAVGEQELRVQVHLAYTLLANELEAVPARPRMVF